ncbi:MAG: hypothetical protein MZW92_56570 [Comamonadaceae bacterium]|nr:hypothetical protein [Comamonadaceae bacterium]
MIARFDVHGRRRRRARAQRCRAATCRSSSSAARSLAEPRVLLVDQPTWGVDVGAAAADPQRADRAARRAAAPSLVVSEELDELFELCDRLMVIAQRPPVAGGRRARHRRRRARPLDGRPVRPRGWQAPRLPRARAGGRCSALMPRAAPSRSCRRPGPRR